MDVYMSNLPSGAGYRNFLHYAQLIQLEKEGFKRYDYDNQFTNYLKYNSLTPPDYDLKRLDFPIAIFAGKYDLLADEKDVKWIYQ